MKITRKGLPLLITLFISLGIFAQDKYNLNFDDFNPAEQQTPTDWIVWGNFKSVTGEKTADENSVGKVVSDGNGKYGCIAYKITANYVGDTIQLTGRMKYENVVDFVGFFIRIDGYTSKKSLAFESMQKLKINGTKDWATYSIKIPYPSNAKDIWVSGILGEKGTAWFDDFKVTIDGKDIQTLEETYLSTLDKFDSGKLKSAIAEASEKLDWSDEASLNASLDPLISKIADKKIVAIGESTHGTAEFYQLREIITKKLVEEKGFDLVILESSYDDIEILNKDLNTASIDSVMGKHLFSIYQTAEMRSFLQWYKNNRAKYQMDFKGCDDSYWAFYDLLKSHFTPTKDKKLYKLLGKLQSNILKSTTDNFKKEVKIGVAIYDNIQAVENHLKETKNLTKSVEEVLFNGKNTYINYVHIKNQKPLQSRDEIMAERISFLAKKANRKLIVWAHNAHISNEIIVDDEIGIMGRDLKKEFGQDYYSIGLTTSQGNYSYIDEKSINGDHDYKEPLKSVVLQPQKGIFWENTMIQNGNSFYVDMADFKKEMNTDQIMGLTRLIGYRMETEEDVYLLPLAKNFDCIIYVKDTHATKPIFN